MKRAPWLLAVHVIAATCTFLPAAPAAEDPADEPLNATEGDLAHLSGGHAWKWRAPQKKPYQEITIVLVRCVRTNDGTFERNPLTATSYSGGKARPADEILVLGAGDKEQFRICMDISNGATRSSTTFANVKWDDFSPTGSGTGGVPPRIGDDYVLMVRGKDGKPVDASKGLKADDAEAYIGVRVQTK